MSKSPHYLIVNDAALHSMPDDMSGASFHVDKLTVNIDEDALLQYVEAKKKSFVDPGYMKDWIAAYEQILAHESFHLYQTLSCSLLSDYSLAKRKEALEIMRRVTKIIEKGFMIAPSEKGIVDLLESFESVDEAILLLMIKMDRDKTRRLLDERATDGAISVREVVEDGAIAFQLLSQDDVRDTKVPLRGAIYYRAWSRFTEKFKFNADSDEELRFARLVFLFLTDIYLKTINESSYAIESFEKAIDMLNSSRFSLGKYQSAYADGRTRDSYFMNSLRHVERKEEKIESIIECCGFLDEKEQMNLFINVCLYADVFKKLALVGLPEKKIDQCNKNKSANFELEKMFTFWGSHFSIPIILSSKVSCEQFSFIWTRLSNLEFIDDTRDVQISFEAENILLTLLDELMVASRDSTMKMRCCKEHEYTNRSKYKRCENPGSLNMKCQQYFGKSLEEVVYYG